MHYTSVFGACIIILVDGLHAVFKRCSALTVSAVWLFILYSERSAIALLFRRGVYPKGVRRAISHIFKSGGWQIGHLCYIFSIDCC